MPKNILVRNFACLSFRSELPTCLLLPEKMQKMECYHEMNKYEKLFYGKKKSTDCNTVVLYFCVQGEDSKGEGKLACCSPWGCKELDMTKRLSDSYKCYCYLARIQKAIFVCVCGF